MKKDGTLRRLFGYLGQNRKHLILAVVFACFSTVFVLTEPLARGRVVDMITAGIHSDKPMDLKAIGLMCLLTLALQILLFYADQKEQKLLTVVSSSVTRKFRDDMYQKLDRLPMSYYFSRSSGDILSNLTNDTSVVGQNLTSGIFYLGGGSITMVAALIIMLFQSVPLTLVSIGVTFAGSALVMFVGKLSGKYYSAQAEATGRLDGYIDENFSNHSIVSAYNHEESSRKEFDQINEGLKRTDFKAQSASGLGAPISIFSIYFSTLMIYLVGAIMTMSGSFTFGQLVAFVSFNSILATPINRMASSIQGISNMGAALKRIFRLLDEEELLDESGKEKVETESTGEVVFDHVRFGYDPSRLIIRDFSENVRSGQKIAIVGPTGAGKTTLINLLMRFYEINGGRICVDGVDISLLTREALREKFSMVLQDPWVFDGTIWENLTFGTKDAGKEKVEKAVRAVGLDYYLNTLPEGYETKLDSSMVLSQGQKQQICIARAMIADRPMVILDEATSSIDTRTEQKIQQAMDRLMEGRTSFVIAHRLSTIKNADTILVLKDGDILESGNHEELLKKKGFYSELYYSQFYSPAAAGAAG